MGNELRDTLSILKLYYTYNPENNFKEKKPKNTNQTNKKKGLLAFTMLQVLRGKHLQLEKFSYLNSSNKFTVY